MFPPNREIGKKEHQKQKYIKYNLAVGMMSDRSDERNECALKSGTHFRSPSS
jgi:hypothetical protein